MQLRKRIMSLTRRLLPVHTTEEAMNYMTHEIEGGSPSWLHASML